MYGTEMDLAETIEALGGKLYLVGGAVRDSLLGLPAHDFDFLVTGVPADSLPFERVVGNTFPVFLVEVSGRVCELALARSERKEGTGHKGFEFFTDPSLTVEDDLYRRDITINTIALDLGTGEYVSPYGGLEDLEAGIIRHTSPAFAEDPLRVLRVARFAARFGFKVAPETLALMYEMRGELSSLPAERVWAELRKVLDCARPDIFFRVLEQAAILDVLFPEISALNVPDRHDGTSFEHTMRAIAAAETPIERWGCLCHDFGKGVTDPAMHPRHHRHDELGVPVVQGFCERLRIPNEYRDFGVLCAREHMRMQKILTMRPGKALRLLLSLGKYADDFCRVVYLENISSDASDNDQVIEQHCQTVALLQLAYNVRESITGRDLLNNGFKSGPHLGEVLEQRRIEAFVRRRLEWKSESPQVKL